MIKPRHVLVFRFSSLGDVAMTVPVLKLVLQQHPELRVTMVSNQFVQPLFEGLDRLYFHVVDPKMKHKGISGMFRLSRELKSLDKFDSIADLHNVLRTKLLRFFFRFSGLVVSVIDKGRKEKKELTRPQNKLLRPLKSTFSRYAEVFEKLGLPVQLEFESGIVKLPVEDDMLQIMQEGFKVVGIAPFALHTEKMYPPDKMKEVIRLLEQHSEIKVLLLGDKNDASLLEQWETGFSHVRSLAGKINFQKELKIISQLDLMVSMDSANMHLASLYGVPVISIWGGTHPYLGFYGWGQLLENAIQVDLECRPSSVFGNKPCPRGDLACLNLISPVTIYEKILKELKI